MSTSEAEPYIARNTSEESISRTPVELQAVLFSSSSISILPSVEVISMASRRATRRAHLLSLSSPFPARHPQTQRALVTGGQAASSPTQQSGSERRAARCGPGEAAAVARRQAQQRRRGSRAPDRAFVALKSTGSRRRVGTHSCPPSRSVGRSYPPRPHQGGAPQRHRRLRVDASARICRSRLLTTRPSSRMNRRSLYGK
jgi:hypothetical protein